ncbi:hypothetical protein PRUPE_8G221800 [Prunus persica]|uniref:Serine/threonine kinase 19 n=1 Tax=Prunus persica TaxID=3760 RepID=A0A251N1N5_PRUPE|nr:hypothetical protein PRUPE_8G221800 [Prunus persica]
MAKNISESLKGKKRARETDTEAEASDFDQILSLEENLTFSDTLVALRIMRAQFPQSDKCTLLALGGKVKDEHISLLINSGLLTRQLIDSNIYWFAIPNIGSVLKGLSQGRKEVLSLLNRRRYKEMMLAPLEKKLLRYSPLDMRFHLRDLIGSGHLKTAKTPTGLVVRVSKD